MNVLVTGAKGFIGKHTCLWLKRRGHVVFEYDIDNSIEELKEYLSKCQYVIHLAGVNRPLNPQEFYDGNTNFTIKLVKLIKEINKEIIIIANSSTQAELDNDYGKSKKQAEDYLLNSGLTVYIYRFANAFGKWCRPNYNSAISTFCYNIAHDLPVTIRDPNYVVHLNYIEDIVSTLIDVVEEKDLSNKNKVGYITPTYDCSLGKQVELLAYFKEKVESDEHLPLLHNEFEIKLFITFLDYLSEEGHNYNYAKDERGYFEELYKSKKYGQISMNMSYPGIVKGGHYHTYKKEIFYVVKGHCEIKQRDVTTNERRNDDVDSKITNKKVDIIPNSTHSIANVGNENSYTIMWISEVYNPLTHDTFKAEL